LEKNSLPLPRIESIFVGCLARILVTIPASPSPITGVAEHNGNGICALLDYYVTNSCNFLPTFRDNVSVSSKMGHVGRSETSVIIYHYSLRNNAEERSSHLLLGGNLKSRKMKMKQIFQRRVFLYA